MSNIIKAYAVRYKADNTILIDYRDKAWEPETKQSGMDGEGRNDGEFKKGLQAVVVDEIKSEEEQKKEAGAIIENARKKAEEILKKAREEAARIKEEAFIQASKQGYNEGLKKACEEAEKIKKELNEQKNRQEMEYQKLIADMEESAAELIASLVKKITGIEVEDKKDIIIYLIEKGLRAYDSLDSYNIRVSSADYEYVLSKKEYLEGILGRDIQITADAQLEKNQCLIESENKIIDLSLNVQLDNLANDIKLLACTRN